MENIISDISRIIKDISPLYSYEFISCGLHRTNLGYLNGVTNRVTGYRGGQRTVAVVSGKLLSTAPVISAL